MIELIYSGDEQHAHDEYGNAYVRFEVDYLALQEPGMCEECGETIEGGWLCLDGGAEYCNDCVKTVAPVL